MERNTILYYIVSAILWHHIHLFTGLILKIKTTDQNDEKQITVNTDISSKHIKKSCQLLLTRAEDSKQSLLFRKTNSWIFNTSP